MRLYKEIVPIQKAMHFRQLSSLKRRAPKSLIEFNPGAQEQGGGRITPSPPDFGRSLNLIPTRGQIMPTTLLHAPPPRIFKSSYGSASTQLKRQWIQLIIKMPFKLAMGNLIIRPSTFLFGHLELIGGQKNVSKNGTINVKKHRVKSRKVG